MYHSALFSGILQQKHLAMESVCWHSVHEPLYWLLSAATLATAATPAFLRSISKTQTVAITALWLTLCTVTLLMFNLLPALATTLVSLLTGIVLLAASLVFSGIKSMPNQRFEERKP